MFTSDLGIGKHTNMSTFLLTPRLLCAFTIRFTVARGYKLVEGAISPIPDVSSVDA